MKWWDIRNIKKATREFLVVVDEDETDPEKAEGVNSLSFESTIPSKFMIGTDKGKIISCRSSQSKERQVWFSPPVTILPQAK